MPTGMHSPCPIPNCASLTSHNPTNTPKTTHTIPTKHASDRNCWWWRPSDSDGHRLGHLSALTVRFRVPVASGRCWQRAGALAALLCEATVLLISPVLNSDSGHSLCVCLRV